MKNHKLVIKRKRWLNGSNVSSTCLRDIDKNMCCLGFLAKSCGLKTKDIIGESVPLDLLNNYDDYDDFFNKIENTPFEKLFNRFDERHSSSCISLMYINDNNKINNKKREKLLKKEFRKIGVSVSFVGKHNICYKNYNNEVNHIKN